MNKLSTIILSAGFLITIAAPAGAMQIPTYPTNTCTGTCDTATPGEPFNPFPEGCMRNCDQPEVGETCMVNCDSAEIPGKDPETFAADGCGSKLGLLREVTAAEVLAVDRNDLVDIIPVCLEKALAGAQEEVATLRPAIDQNEVLDRKLGREGFEPQHVVGVVVEGRHVVLYVHS
jgi:hypothetical protein